MFAVLTIISIFFPMNYVYAADKTANEVTIEMDGYGSQEYPFLITNTEDLDNLREVVNSGNSLQGLWFALINDIDFQGEYIEPLSDQTSGKVFWGGFDGRGHKIYNFKMKSDTESMSFFGHMNGVVENLYLEGTISGKLAASFATKGYGVILNCISYCDLSASRQASGMVNNWNGLIMNAIFGGELDATEKAGIVNTGNGTASYVYSQGNPIGNIMVKNDCGMINGQEKNAVIDILNDSAKLCFITSPYGQWLNEWILDKDKIVLSEDIVAFKGTGFESHPFAIDSVEKLEMVAFYLNAGFTFEGVYLYQTEDIDLSNTSWDIISSESLPFRGIYNGNGHIIRGLHTDGAAGGLFNNFDGTILNLGIEECDTPNGCGFGGIMGDSSLILNSYCQGKIGDFTPLNTLIDMEQLVNCYVDGLVVPTDQELNEGLDNLVINYGIHCGELYQWKNDEGGLKLHSNYQNTFFANERSYWKGSGVEKDPYQIGNLADLVYLRESVHYNESFWRYWFIQTGDIDFSSVRYWKAISDEGAVNSFRGVYDGDGRHMTGFHPSNQTSVTPNESIFGNLNGTVMNLHCQKYKAVGIGNGIIAYNAFPNAKIINNVVEIDASDVTSVISLVYNNSGKILNNVIICPTLETPVTVIQNMIQNTEEIVSEQEYNQILTEITDENIQKFNEQTLITALHLKQRITNFNLLTLDSTTINLNNSISLFSAIGTDFVRKMVTRNFLLLVVVLWSVSCVIYGIAFWIYRSKKKELYWSTEEKVQISIVLGVNLLFIIAMKICKPNAIWGKTFIGLTVSLGMGFLWTVLYLIRFSILRVRNGIHWNYKNVIPIGAVLFITGLIAVMHYSTPVAYDSDLYYGSFIQSVQNFNFTISGILESFCIASKPMHGIAMLMVIGEALFPGTGIGIYIMNTVLLLLAQISIYKILIKLFSGLSSKICALLTLCFGFSGYVLVGVTYINPDFYSVIAFTFFIYCWLYGYRILALYSGFLVLSSKPNMIISYLLFLCIFFVADVLWRKIEIRKWIPHTFCVAIYLVLYLGFNSLNRVGVPEASNNEFLTFLGSRLMQYLAYGFIWIQEIFIIWTIIYLIKKRCFHIFKDMKSVLLFSIWISCFSQLLIQLVGGSTLQLCPRYLTVCTIKNIVLFAFAIDILPAIQYKRKILVSGFSILLSVQLFTTIDPAIILTAPKKYDGLYYLVFPSTKSDGNDLTFYNYEYAKDARTGSDILSNLSSYEIAQLYSDNRTGYKMAIGSSSIYAAYWDTKRNCRTYLRNDDSVRLGLKMIKEGLNTKSENNIHNLTLILRSGNSSFLKDVYPGDWKQDNYGSFTVYQYEDM